MKINNNIPDFLANYPATKETPSGAKNSSNKVYTLAGIPVLFVDFYVVSSLGVVTKPVFAYTTPAGVATLTFATYAPVSTDTLVVYSI